MELTDNKKGQSVEEFINKAIKYDYSADAIISRLVNIDVSEVIEGSESMKKLSKFVLDKIEDIAITNRLGGNLSDILLSLTHVAKSYELLAKYEDAILSMRMGYALEQPRSDSNELCKEYRDKMCASVINVIDAVRKEEGLLEMVTEKPQTSEDEQD